MTEKERNNRLAEAMKDVRKKFGEKAVRSGRSARSDRRYLSTGSLGLDRVLGGGYVRGRTYELFGEESTGKTTLALTAIAQVQKAGGSAVYIDNERAIDWDYAERLGVDLDHEGFAFVESSSAEESLEIVRTFTEAGVDLIVCDTVAAMATRAEIKGEIGDAHVGQLARLMSQAMRILTSEVKGHDVVLLFLNQVREKIGVMWGETETTPGGRALKFYSSGRLAVSAGKRIKSGDDVVGRWCRVMVKKSKTSAPFQTVQFPIIFGLGIDRLREVLTAAVDVGIVTKKKGSGWYRWGKEKWCGEAGFAKLVEEQPEVLEELWRAVVDGIADA